MRRPYIGITGFTRPEEVLRVLEVFPKVDRRLMVGVLVSYKSLRRLPTNPRWARQMPSPEMIKDLFIEDERVVNLVHYCAEEGQESSMLGDMLKIHDLAGPNFHGFQLNLVWPEIWLLEEYRKVVGEGPRIVLQISKKAIEQAGEKTENVVEKLSLSRELIDDVLLDQSRGRGQPLATEEARRFLLAIKEKGWDLGLGVAGGLGPDSLYLVEPLVADFPELNIDAQSQLRDSENDLDLERAKTYLIKALKMFNLY